MEKNIPSLRSKYKGEVVSGMQKMFGWKNMMQVPKLTKICLNQGVGGGITDKKLVDTAAKEMSLISGQQAVITFSKKPISNFKLRENMPIGCKVTLRGNKMYEFMERLIAIALPRVRDFQGLSDKGFDGRGNYTMGVTEQVIFPEIDIDKVSNINGMDITFVTTSNNDIECLELLKALGVPFKNQNK